MNFNVFTFLLVFICSICFSNCAKVDSSVDAFLGFEVFTNELQNHQNEAGFYYFGLSPLNEIEIDGVVVNGNFVLVDSDGFKIGEASTEDIASVQFEYWKDNFKYSRIEKEKISGAKSLLIIGSLFENEWFNFRFVSGKDSIKGEVVYQNGLPCPKSCQN